MKKALLLLLILTVSVVGQEEYFGQNKVQYKNYKWHYIQTHNFDIYIDQDQDSIAKFAATVLENAYSIISREVNHKLTIRVPVVIYSSPNDFVQTNIISELLPEGVGGFTEIFKTRIVVPFNGSYERNQFPDFSSGFFQDAVMAGRGLCRVFIPTRLDL